MDFIEFKKDGLIDNTIEIKGIQEGGLGRIYFGYCRNRLIRVVIKTFLKSLWEEHHLAEKNNASLGLDRCVAVWRTGSGGSIPARTAQRRSGTHDGSTAPDHGVAAVVTRCL